MEEAVVEVHLCAVDLAERVLPALQKIGASALGFAVVSFFNEQLFCCRTVDGRNPKQPPGMYKTL